MGRKVRVREGFVVDEESVERIIDSVVPGLVALLRLLLKKSLCVQ
jgi:hypothetical protein